MPFKYVASTQSGKLERGVSDLASRRAVIADLESRGLVVVSVEDAKLLRAARRASTLFFGNIRHIDKVLITKHLSVMLRAGLTLLESLRTLEEQAVSWRLRLILGRIARAVEHGDALSDALAEYPHIFSQFYINIIRAGEVSGNLENNLDHLAVQLTKDHDIRSKVRSALIYPVFIIVAAALIGFFFATYVIPQVAHLFSSLKGIKLPILTVILLDIADFTRRYTLLTFGGGTALVLFIIWFLRRRFMAPLTNSVALHLPVLAGVTKNISLARFSLVMSTLLKSGIPITKSLEVAADVLDNYYYKRALRQALAAVIRGEPLSESLARSASLFPKITSRMIGVGEKSGKLEEVLGYLSDYYDLEVETTMKNLSTIIEPVMLIVIGLITLGLAFAIIIPIYNFIGVISKI